MKLKLLFFPLSIVLSLFFFIYFTKPTWNKYSENRESLATEDVALGRVRGNRDNLSEILAVYKDVSIEKRLLLDNSIPNDLQEEGFLKELSNAISDSGVKISGIKLTKMERLNNLEDSSIDNSLEETKASISLTGDYFGLKKALYSIENFNRFVRIDNFSINEDGTSNNLDFSLDLFFFNRKTDDKLRLSLESRYLENLLKNGLEMSVLEDYVLYRENVIDFSLIGSERKGKDNLFDTPGGDNLEITEEAPIAEESIPVDNLDLSQDQNIEEVIPVE